MLERNFRSPFEPLNSAYFGDKERLTSGNQTLRAMEKKNEINILIADDDDDDREFFTEVVSEIAPLVSIKNVKNGVALMEYINKADLRLPDIIFLDLNMPCKNGRECLKEIKKSEKFRHIPIVIYSTSSNIKDIENAYNDGADLYVTKPNSFSELKKIAKKVFSIDWSNLVLNHRIERFVLK
jgi:CheY-like chemotaxis protein